MKRIIAIVLLAVLVGGLTGFAAYEYQHRPKPAPVVTYSKQQYESVVSTMQTHDAINKVKVDQLTEQNKTSAARTLAVCTHIKSLKQTDPNCQ